MANYRQLTAAEKERLLQNGCHCSDWNLIQVKDTFNPERYVRVEFSGKVSLGSTEMPPANCRNMSVKSGIFDAYIDNCTIGDNVRISHINDLMSNYKVGDGCYLANIGTLTTSAGASFGNGTRVNVLSETGGRTNIIFDKLSGQIAYLMTFYRHDRKLIENLTALIDRYVESKKADFGTIGENAVITNCGSITDVCIGRDAKINGASRLVDGTVGERASVGAGVIAEHFIIQSEGAVDNASIIKNTLVGQASQLSNCFVAHDSMFFANCAMECGEAVAVFAGPHTVSMHKSTLLIGGYFSFFNAGSGTNQSNHLYKLGPIHQGIMERGCKTASNTYVMWPARFGAFSLVSGSHYSHPDTSALPYSYALSAGGKTLVIPAANLKTMGTIRDLLKWANRDKRAADIDRYDLISYDNLNPLTTNGMYDAITFLNDFESSPDQYKDRRFSIEPTSVKKGKEYYALGVEYFMGEAFVQRLLDINPDSESSLSSQLARNPEKPYAKWIDLAGMIAPADLIDGLCADVATGKLDSVDSVTEALKNIYSRYPDLKWAYVTENLCKCYSVAVDGITPEIAIAIISRWREAVTALDRLRKDDALKDFSEPMSTGFGINGDAECRINDFKAVNGNPEENHVIVTVHKHYTDALLDAHEMVSRIKKAFAITD